MADHRLAEVFGYPVDNFSSDATYNRTEYLCPFTSGDREGKCTKFLVRDKKTGFRERNMSNGVCSIQDGTTMSIICPVRFREARLVLRNAAVYFFGDEVDWLPVPERKLKNAAGQSLGKIDFVLVTTNDAGAIEDFGALEIQGVYISGNVGTPFAEYLKAPTTAPVIGTFHADYLSSVKRLLQQLIRKGIILSAWGKKQAIAVDDGFFAQLAPMKEVSKEESDMAWFVYSLVLDEREKRYHLRLSKTVYTTHKAFLDQFSTAEAGDSDEFVAGLQKKVQEVKGAKVEEAVNLALWQADEFSNVNSDDDSGGNGDNRNDDSTYG